MPVHMGVEKTAVFMILLPLLQLVLRDERARERERRRRERQRSRQRPTRYASARNDGKMKRERERANRYLNPKLLIRRQTEKNTQRDKESACA